MSRKLSGDNCWKKKVLVSRWETSDTVLQRQRRDRLFQIYIAKPGSRAFDSLQFKQLAASSR